MNSGKLVFVKKCLTGAISLMIIIMFFAGCSKILEVKPPINEIIGEEIYSSNKKAASVVTGIYASWGANSNFNGRTSLSLLLGVSSDELGSVANDFDVINSFYLNNLLTDDAGLWSNFYAYIFKINSAMEGITRSKGVTDDVRSRLIGELRFLRALQYFYLVNIYGDVPLALTTDIKETSTLARAASMDVYHQIEVDLLFAEQNLSKEYVNADILTPTDLRFRPNSYAANALLARVYLYEKKWKEAEIKSSLLINETSMFKLENLENTFLNNSKEAIWQIQPTSFGYNTLDATIFVLSGDPGLFIPAGPNPDSKPVFITSDLYNSFELNDLRRKSWIDTVTVEGVLFPFAFKYKVWQAGQPLIESTMMLRLAEQYLIRAEARAEQGIVNGGNSAQDDINALRKRAGLNEIELMDVTSALMIIRHERKVELFTELGHRWLDLKRTGKIDSVMMKVGEMKGHPWQSYKSLFPLPTSDIKNNPSLKGHQNPGYPEQ
ncbi:RagB/SusD family nutrient uptake outer membrane protein [Chitinophaga filiformis]|uniref:RagB/SusD family nutrient uptake outer membrane protein n=1 Tax=Chitinophaga filiformis TaxID=104663 RepID=UPI001F43E14A|nr:RagB/SusD family nutrient uptake outer membrane protein [Chitinophaga filiformis]MCF6401332.1 RagB/SusD family nutrient uptake outer membrane protein [Chitinophaga filiformis]